MVNLPPPSYEVATRRVDRHYLTCTRPGNEEILKPLTKYQVGTFAVRGWIASNGGTTAAVGPWWMYGEYRQTWEVAKPAPDQTTKPTKDRSTKEKVMQALRGLRGPRPEQETVSIFAVNGTPMQPGEIEYTMDTTESSDYDWIEKWGWKVNLTAYTYAKHVRCSQWTINYTMFLDDLPSLLQAGGISWKDTITDNGEDLFEPDFLRKRRWNWVRSSSCSPVSAYGQKWKACVEERHWKKPFVDRDFRDRLSAETVQRAKIYQRTGPRRYKFAMMYDLDTVYGNDISGQRVDVWHDGLAENFARFIRPLVPYDPYQATRWDMLDEMAEKRGEP